MMMIPFTKMVAAGNDFIVVDARPRRLSALKGRWAAVARTLCDRHHGIGGDGVLVLEPSRAADVKMRVFNPDGSEASMCGNGARCVALHLTRQGRGHRTVAIETGAGILSARTRGNRVAMQMMPPSGLRPGLALAVGGRTVHATAIRMGVPHLVVPVTALDRVDVHRMGRALRSHRAFGPQGTNVDFIQPNGRWSRLRVRTYERGVEAETLACGTGVTASAIVHGLQHARRSPKQRITVETRSGDLMTVSFAVVVSGRGVRVTNVTLEGTARRICQGTVSWPLEAR